MADIRCAVKPRPVNVRSSGADLAAQLSRAAGTSTCCTLTPRVKNLLAKQLQLI